MGGNWGLPHLFWTALTAVEQGNQTGWSGVSIMWLCYVWCLQHGTSVMAAPFNSPGATKRHSVHRHLMTSVLWLKKVLNSYIKLKAFINSISLSRAHWWVVSFSCVIAHAALTCTSAGDKKRNINWAHGLEKKKYGWVDAWGITLSLTIFQSYENKGVWGMHVQLMCLLTERRISLYFWLSAASLITRTKGKLAGSSKPLYKYTSTCCNIPLVLNNKSRSHSFLCLSSKVWPVGGLTSIDLPLPKQALYLQCCKFRLKKM